MTPHTMAKTTHPNWKSLTWDDLQQWAGGRSVSRGQTYQRQGRVEDLAISAEGHLLATVTGGQAYAVTVWLNTDLRDDPKLQSRCTCPVGSNGCKHAVATVAAYLDRLANGEKVPIADADDPRWQSIEQGAGALDEEDSDEPAPSVAASRSGKQETWDAKIKAHIDAKSRRELAELVWSLTERFPELREEFRERIALGEGKADQLIAQARKELRRVTSQEAWSNHWTGEGRFPDYGRLIRRMERLIEMGQSDAVARLTPEIVECGMEQVGRSHDEGELWRELGRCLKVAFEAVGRSSLPPEKKLLMAIDAHLQEDYDILSDATAEIFNQTFRPADWSAVADELAGRLAASAAPSAKDENDLDDFSHKYHRDRLSDWLARALENADRGDEILPLYEAEAPRTGSYQRLVRRLMDRKDYDRAARWAREGIDRTAEKWPGLANELAEALCEIARIGKQWDLVAAHAAWHFVERPDAESHRQLMDAAKKAGRLEPVREHAQIYLETGKPPFQRVESKSGPKLRTAPHWPLPMPEALLPLMAHRHRRGGDNRPHFDVLIDLAIAHQQPDEVLKWYDKLQAEQQRRRPGDAVYGGHCDSRVAEAVAASHPRRALEIHQQQIQRLLPHAGISAYESIAGLLRQMKPIFDSLGREEEWTARVADLREQYKRRPRFVEILDRLEQRPIIAARQRRG